VFVLSGCPLVTKVYSGKTADSIEMLFAAVGQVGPGNHVLDGGTHPPWEMANFRGKWGCTM